MPNHRPVEAFIEKHTTRLRPANNKSGRYIVKCNFCDYEGEHRELRIPPDGRFIIEQLPVITSILYQC